MNKIINKVNPKIYIELVVDLSNRYYLLIKGQVCNEIVRTLGD